MTPQNIKRARRFLISSIVAALLLIGAVTGLYYWKGLDNLKSKTNPQASYYVYF